MKNTVNLFVGFLFIVFIFNKTYAQNGSCLSPNLAYNNGAAFSPVFPNCAGFLTASSNKITTYWTVRSSATGTLGVVQQVGADLTCNYLLATRKGYLYAPGDCNGTVIPPTTALGPNSSTFNPEWIGLVANTNYIIKIEMDVDMFCDQTMFSDVCVNRYDPVLPSCDPTTFSLYNNTSFSSVHNSTFSCSDGPVYLAPASFNSIYATGQPDAGWPFPSIKVEVIAVSGNFSNTLLKIYDAVSGILVDQIALTASDPIYYHYFAKPNGYRFAFDKINTASGSYNYTITDVISGAVLANSTWTVTNGAESAKSVICKPTGTGTYSCPTCGPGALVQGIAPVNLDEQGIVTFDPSKAGAGNHTLTYTWNNNSTSPACSGSSSINITVAGTPSAPTITGNTSICSGNSVTLTATAPGGTYTWYKAATGGTTFYTGNTYTSSILTNDTTFYVETLSGSCKSATRTPITVTVIPAPSAPSITGATNICSGNSATLNVTSTGSTYSWYAGSVGGSAFYSGFNYTTSILTNDTTIYVGASSSGCLSATRTPVTITVTNTPTAPTITGITSICSGNSVTLTATAPGGTYTWYKAATGGTNFYTGSTYTTSILTSDTTVYVETSSGSCNSITRTPVAITVTTTDNASFNYSSGTFCNSGTATAVISGLAGGTFTSSQAGLVFVDNNPASNSGEVDLVGSTSPQTYTITYTTNGACPNTSVFSLSITTNPADPSFSYSSFSMCKGSGNESPIFTTGSGGVFTSSPAGLSLSSSGVINLVTSLAGTYDIVNSISGGGCVPVSGTETITIDSAATPIGNATQTFCNAATIADLSATGSNLLWYDAPVNGALYVISTPLVDGNHYYASQTVGSCNSVLRLDVFVTINIPVAPIGNGSQNFCTASTIADLSATGSNIQWYDLATSGNLYLSTDALVDGNHYYASQTINGCTSLSLLDVAVTINIPLAPNGTPNQIFCNTATIADLSVAGSNVQWYDAALGGNLYSPSDALIDGNHYYSSQTVNGCESQLRLDVTVTINSTSSPAGTTSQLFCNSATIADLSATGTNIQWYDATNGNLYLQSDVLVDGNHYYASQTISGCESNSKLDVLVSIINPAVPLVSPDNIYCEGNLSDMTASGTGSFTWYSDAGLTNLIATGNSLSPFNTPGTATYYVTQLISGCEGLAAAINISITASPVTAVGMDKVQCYGAVIPALTAIGTGLTIQWYSDATLSNQVGVGLTFNTGKTAIGSYSFYINQTENGCVGKSDTVTLTITPPGLAPVASEDVSYCENDSPNLDALKAIGSVSGDFEWYADPGLSQLVGTGNFVPSNTVGQTTYYVIEKNGNCRSYADSVVVTVNSAPDANFTYTPSGGAAPLNVTFSSATIDLSGTSVNLLWNFSDSNTSNDSVVSYILQDAGQYTVTLMATNQYGCSDSASYSIDVIIPSSLEIPNVFTPNNDNRNDIFNVKGVGLRTIFGSIYNRWGELIYEWDTVYGGWNGTTMAGVKVPEGTYYYMIKAYGFDDAAYQYQGQVLLMR